MKKVFLLTACLFSGCLLAARGQVKKLPNIIFFLVDDMGWQDTSVPFWDSITPANRKFRTPNMERLCRAGTKFTNAYAHSVCTPSRVSLMTGMNVARHRVSNWTSMKNKAVDGADSLLTIPDWNVNGISPIPGQERSVYATPLPALLQQQGYYTIQCGKAHFGAYQTVGADPLNLGFVKNIGGSAGGHPASYLAEDDFGRVPGKFILQAEMPGLDKYRKHHSFLTEDLTQEAMLAMDTAQMKQQPFFLYMAHYAVHLPYNADDRFIQRYLDLGLPKPEAAYAALVEGMDQSLGELMDYLEQHHLTDNTIIVFMSDNGGFSHPPRQGAPNSQNYPLRGGKGSLYEGGVREPMIVRWNGITTPGSVNTQYMIMEDFYPTILEWAGLKSYKTVQTIDGRSIVPFLRNPALRDTTRALVWNFPNDWTGGALGDDNAWLTAIRQGKWKLVYCEKQQRLELYNLEEDIHEAHNVASDYPHKTRELAKLLTQQLKQRKAQMPLYKATGKPVPYPDALVSFR
ncbi:sulfatase [Chitinophaga sp. Ak27]|uniref:sulfatase n=1 Tax=Chitinophaga sp. Ak27 TaxID=2726116 RepID=UPI00145D41BA|nr:sulfatase [Chitinophaga sp. Ak27]NLU95750.1 sulfatase [Chitinophaga sp. Ak27]